MKSLSGRIYHDFHSKYEKYGFAHHLTTKTFFFKKYIGCGKKILDLGSRDGVLTEKFLPNNFITCLDIDYYALRLCRAKSNVNAICSDINNPLPFQNNIFDVVVMSDVIEHIILGEQLIQETSRVLKSNGICIGSTPNGFYWLNRVRILYGIDPVNYIDPTHVRIFSRDSLQQLIRKRFLNVQVIPYGKHPFSRWYPTLFASDFFWLASKQQIN